MCTVPNIADQPFPSDCLAYHKYASGFSHVSPRRLAAGACEPCRECVRSNEVTKWLRHQSTRRRAPAWHRRSLLAIVIPGPHRTYRRRSHMLAHMQSSSAGKLAHQRRMERNPRAVVDDHKSQVWLQRALSRRDGEVERDKHRERAAHVSCCNLKSLNHLFSPSNAGDGTSGQPQTGV